MNKPTVLNSDEWFVHHELSDEMISYLWDQIDIAKEEDIDYNGVLVGNLERSLLLRDPDDRILDVFNKIFESDAGKLITKRFANCFKNVLIDENVKSTNPVLKQLWVNFQKKYEFNPLHSHTGIMSFVIWMQIPYDWENEIQRPGLREMAKKKIGNFSFVSRDFTDYTFTMSPKLEGHMVLFPSDLRHEVHPFYTSDEERISISGNIYFELQS